MLFAMFDILMLIGYVYCTVALPAFHLSLVAPRDAFSVAFQCCVTRQHASCGRREERRFPHNHFETLQQRKHSFGGRGSAGRSLAAATPSSGAASPRLVLETHTPVQLGTLKKSQSKSRVRSGWGASRLKRKPPVCVARAAPSLSLFLERSSAGEGPLEPSDNRSHPAATVRTRWPGRVSVLRHHTT